MESLKPESVEKQTEEQKELEYILEKICFIGLPRNISNELKIALEQFVEKNKEDSLNALRKISEECDMLMNYKAQIQQSYEETNSDVDINKIMALAGQSLFNIRNMIHQYNGSIQ